MFYKASASVVTNLSESQFEILKIYKLLTEFGQNSIKLRVRFGLLPTSV